MKINDIPVAVPELFDTDAVMSPNPTELRENKAINKKAKMIPTISLLELNPNNNAKMKTMTTCIIVRIMLEKILLSIKSVDDIGVVFSLLSNPCSLKSAKDWATVIIMNMQAYANKPGTMRLKLIPSSGSPNAKPKVIVRTAGNRSIKNKYAGSRIILYSSIFNKAKIL